MKKLILITFLAFISMNISYSQVTTHSCCTEKTLTATELFATFAGDKSFVDEHPNPKPFKLEDEKGKMISFDCKDGKTGYAYEVKSDKPTNKYILVFQEWYGVNDYIKQESDELNAQFPDINILAVDLYDGKVAQNNDEAVKYVQSVQTDRAFNIIQGAIDHAGSNAVFGTIGWCFGGGWSLQAAILLGDRCKACVMYYGMPETDKDRLSKLQAPVLGLFALQDTRITPAVVKQFEDDMSVLGKSIQVKSYDAVHAFANPSNPKHDPEATKDAKALTLKFFKDNLE